MRRLWFIIIGTFLIQEMALTVPILALSKEAAISIWSLFILWIIATIFDVIAAYFLGKWLQKRFKDSRIQNFFALKTVAIDQILGNKGKNFTLSMLGFFYYPYAGALVASWVNIPLSNVLLYIIVGNSLWFGVNVGVAYGIFQFTTNISHIISFSIIVSLILAFLIHRVRNKLF